MLWPHEFAKAVVKRAGWRGSTGTFARFIVRGGETGVKQEIAQKFGKFSVLSRLEAERQDTLDFRRPAIYAAVGDTRFNNHCSPHWVANRPVAQIANSESRCNVMVGNHSRANGQG